MSNGEDHISSFLNYIPFVGLMAGKAKQHSPGITRLIEAGIIVYGTVQILGNDINWLKDEMKQMNTRITQVERNQHETLLFMTGRNGGPRNERDRPTDR